MQIRKIGPQPTEQFAIVPNALARDKRLSYRARGVMEYVISHADGFHVNADSISADGTEGRDAIRTAMNELVSCDYLRRVRRQDESGLWRTDINVYPYGDAPPFTGMAGATAMLTNDDLTDDGLSGVGEPTTDFQSSVNQSSVDQSSVDQSVIEHQVEDHSSTSPSDAAAASPTGEVTSSSEEGVSRASGQTFPTVEQRKLVTWFGVGAHQGDAWVAAWEAANAITSDEVDYDPQAHLAIYLSRCREERRAPRSDLWLRFFIEDRAKHIVALREEQQQIDHHHETPQEREDRLNRRLPPTEWGVPAAAETGAGA